MSELWSFSERQTPSIPSGEDGHEGWSFSGYERRETGTAEHSYTEWSFNSRYQFKEDLRADGLWLFNARTDNINLEQDSKESFKFLGDSASKGKAVQVESRPTPPLDSINVNHKVDNEVDSDSGDYIAATYKKQSRFNLPLLLGGGGVLAVILILSGIYLYKPTKPIEKHKRKKTTLVSKKEKKELGKQLLKVTANKKLKPKQKYKTIKKLIKQGAYLNQKSKKGNTPLMVAVQHNDYKIVKYLLKKKAKVNLKNKKKESAMAKAKKLKKKLNKSTKKNKKLKKEKKKNSKIIKALKKSLKKTKKKKKKK